MLIPISAAQGRVVTLEEAKARLRVEHGEDDTEIQLLLDAAVDHVASAAEIVLAPRDYEERLDCWPAGCVRLATGPVREVSAVAYLDASGVEQVLPAASFGWEPESYGAVVWFAPSFDAPRLAERPGAVRIRFSAGFNDPAGANGDPRLDLPRQAKVAVLLLLAHWFQNREAVGDAGAEVPLGANVLIDQLRVWRR